MTTAAPMIYFPLTAELLLRANGALDGLLNPPLIEALLSGKDVAFELALTDTPQVRKMLDILDVDFTTESAPMPDGHVEVGKVWYNKNHKNHAPAQRRKILHLDSKGEIIGQTLATLPGDITVPADVIDPQAYPLTLTIQGTEECPIAFGKGKYGSRILQFTRPASRFSTMHAAGAVEMQYVKAHLGPSGEFAAPSVAEILKPGPLAVYVEQGNGQNGTLWFPNWPNL